MNTALDKPLVLLSALPNAAPIKVILAGTQNRSDDDCQAAWEFLDLHVPGTFTSMITKLAQSGVPQSRIWRTVRNHRSMLDSSAAELMALAIEWASRQAKK